MDLSLFVCCTAHHSLKGFILTALLKAANSDYFIACKVVNTFFLLAVLYCNCTVSIYQPLSLMRALMLNVAITFSQNKGCNYPRFITSKINILFSYCHTDMRPIQCGVL